MDGESSCQVGRGVVDGSIVEVRPYQAHAGKCVPVTLAVFAERILVLAREEEPARPRWKVGWISAVVGPDVEVLEADGKRKRCGNWRRRTDSETDVSEEMKDAQQKIKEPNVRMQVCSTRESGATLQSKGQHSTSCRRMFCEGGVAPSAWRVKSNSDGGRVREPGDSAEEPQAKRTTEAPDPATEAQESGAEHYEETFDK